MLRRWFDDLDNIRKLFNWLRKNDRIVLEEVDYLLAKPWKYDDEWEEMLSTKVDQFLERKNQ